MAGNVFVWNYTAPSGVDIVTRTNVAISVRSLCWSPNGAELYIGDMAGNIHAWSPTHESSAVRLIFGLNGSITALQWSPSPSVSTVPCLAAATTDGTLALLQAQPGDNVLLRPSLVFKAHRASKGEQDLRFGSLTKFAEIWSLAWSPDGRMIATSSEDQTTRIWTVPEGD
jgi:WD40 repeat protein